ncbi:LacI family DNA-binding transcriptional regulator [Companilactobacillus hulinensis]|uniref:LacI family DNA-binding transcriptional regulator n=1 Tax=Companilactobacillus hulinensis TaxID=2486007 RepID=UPI000F76F23B|nr:LacI family DNA-binding transcriptional regulator [Companilactobacillus hulinensis]
MANIRDVAKLSGHSISTVSRVINQRGYVAGKTAAEVRQAMKTLNYHRNDLARALSLGKTYRVGVVLPYVNHPYFQKLADAIISAAFANNYQATFLQSNYSPEEEIKFLDMLKHHAFDGLIFTSRAIPFDKLVEYKKYGPITCCEDTFDYPLSSAFTDRRASFVNALQTLKDQGYTKIGMTISRSENTSQSAKLTTEAYREVFGEDIRDELLFRESKTMFDGITAVAQFLNYEPDLQVAFCNGDEIAAGAKRQLKEMNRSDVLVTGQENLPISFLMGFSSIDHRLTEMGEEAFELLFKDEIIKKPIPSRFMRRGKLRDDSDQNQDEIDRILN